MISPTKVALKVKRYELDWFPVKLYKREILEVEAGLKAMEYGLRNPARRRVDKINIRELESRLWDFDPALHVIYIPVLLPASNLATRTTERQAELNIAPPRPKQPALRLVEARLKWCSRCGEHVERDNFHRNRSRRDGLADWCRPCTNAHANRKYWSAKQGAHALPMAA